MPTKWILIAATVTSIFAAERLATTTALKPEKMVGAWRSKVQFLDGPFAATKDLEFLMAVNQGGTMTESSNYDCMPPVPPAYGAWKQTGTNSFELRYEYFNSKPPTTFDEISKGGGWAPGGRGVIIEKVKLANDGKTYTSKISFVLRDETGKVIPGGGSAVAKGVRISP